MDDMYMISFCNSHCRKWKYMSIMDGSGCGYLCGAVEGKALRGVMCQNVMAHWRFQRNQSWQSLWWNYFVLHVAQGEQNTFMKWTDEENER